MKSGVYGLIAEFATTDELIAAANRSRHEGYVKIDAYSPFPVEGLSDAVGFKKNHIPLIALLGGIAGGIGGFFMQWYAAVVSYPFNIGGRPLNSWPSFIPVTFELTILGAALAAVIGMLILNGLPSLYHPVFNAKDFDLATRNRFFLCIRADDAKFDLQCTRHLLENLHPIRIIETPW